MTLTKSEIYLRLMVIDIALSEAMAEMNKLHHDIPQDVNQLVWDHLQTLSELAKDIEGEING